MSYHIERSKNGYRWRDDSTDVVSRSFKTENEARRDRSDEVGRQRDSYLENGTKPTISFVMVISDDVYNRMMVV